MPRLVEKIFAPLTGLASEAVAHHRQKQQTPSDPQAPAPVVAGSSTENHDHQQPDYELDDELWELDSIAEELHSREAADPLKIPKGSWASPASIEAIVSAFLQKHPPGSPSAGSHLALPVVIPQKRPSKKARGFIRAYSPVLEDCGINQVTWLDFLDSFDESTKVSPAFDVINVAVGSLGMVTNFVPSVAIQVVSTVITIADVIAKETYTRSRTNTFLIDMNERYFKPQGLYCLMITHKPNSDSVVESMNINDIVSASMVAIEDGSSGVNPTKSAPSSAQAENAALNEKIKQNFKLWTGRSSAVTRGEAEMPAVAPLVFVDLEQASPEEKASIFRRGSAFVHNYFDKRAVAQWQAEHPDATLATMVPSPEFLTERGDPNNLKQNTSLRTVVTGQEGRLGAHRRAFRDARQDHKAAKWENMAASGSGVRNLVARATKGKPPIAAVKRLMTMDAIYLLLVQIPSPKELESARAERNR